MSITIVDVAFSAHVSKSTAGRVLAGDTYGVSEEAKAKVFEAAKDLGYVKNTLAKSLRTTHSYTILLIIPDITNSFWAEVARGCQDVFDAYGYSLVLANSDWQTNRELKYLQMAKANHVDAVLVNAPNLDVSLLDSLSCPVVVLGDRLKNMRYPIVGTDTYHAVQLALGYLYAKRHERIAMVYPQGVDGEGTSQIRHQAYKDFFDEKNLPVDENLVTTEPLTMETGGKEALRIRDMADRPTAILTGNDLVAIGFLRKCHEIGLRIPQDISVVGMDDIPAASMVSPSLTTIRKPQREIGEHAAHIVMDMIAEKKVASRTLLAADIVERETVRVLR
jgi:DNA-binding LacI/PurR family transcriptional regulator